MAGPRNRTRRTSATRAATSVTTAATPPIHGRDVRVTPTATTAADAPAVAHGAGLRPA